jgi:hypothetical protein
MTTIRNLTSSNGNFVPNQIVIRNESLRIFQSYDSIIVKIEEGQVYLDERYWNYSKTTSKYRNQFLGDSTKEIETKIKSGEYILTDLQDALTPLTMKQWFEKKIINKNKN